MKNSEPAYSSRSLCKIIGFTVFIICFAGCISGLYVPTTADAVKGSIPLETLKKGRELYVTKCGSCHNLFLPSRYTQTQWVKIVDNMKVRSKIDNMQVQEINQYLKLSAKNE